MAPPLPRARPSSRQKGPELRDFGFLRGNDALCQAPHFRVLAMAEHNARHVYRALVMRDHAGGEITVRIAGEADIHVAVHLVIGRAEFARRGRLIRARARAMALVAPARAGLPVAEYAATVVKKAVVGTGGASASFRIS